MGEFVVGIDLGQVNDFTAIAVMEKVPQSTIEEVVRVEGNMTYRKMAKVEKPPHLYCRYLDRVDLGTKYPDIVKRTKARLAMPELKGATLVVDGTGVGRAVIDMFREAGMSPKAVTITSGSAVNFDQGYWHVPKRDLVAAVQAPLQDKRLLFAEESPQNEVLVKEMTNFKIKITDSANDVYGTWRENEHDDLIFAVMLAAWWAQRKVPTNDIPPSGGARSWARQSQPSSR
jgi:phage terminase large subunit-like protein